MAIEFPNFAHAACAVSVEGSAATVYGRLGIGTVSRTAAGNFLLILDEPIAPTERAVIVTPQIPDSATVGVSGMEVLDAADTAEEQTQQIRVRLENDASAAVDGSFAVAVFRIASESQASPFEFSWGE